MATTLYITRHGETTWNKEGRMQGWNDSPLTELGIIQAEWLRDRIKDFKIDAIYASPSGRAFDTAEIVKGDRNIEILQHQGLREIKLGDFQGLNQQEIKELSEEQYYNYWNMPHMYKPIGEGEGFEDMIERVNEGLKDIIRKHPDESILIVTHTLPIKAIFFKLENRQLSELWKTPFIKQTSLTVIEVENDKYNMMMCADTSHHEYSFKEYNEFK